MALRKLRTGVLDAPTLLAKQAQVWSKPSVTSRVACSGQGNRRF
jgi:hypothetical protein